MLFSNIGIISLGGPGRRSTLFSPSSIITPGAVPFSLSTTIASSGIIACFQLFSVNSKLRLTKYSAILLLDGSCIKSFLPSTFAATSFVRSSSVGPSPPDKITISERSSAVFKTIDNLSSLSPTTLWKKQDSPKSAHFSDR